jgi:hypothetical protein
LNEGRSQIYAFSRSDLPAKRAALRRYRAAVQDLHERHATFEALPSDLTAQEVRWAEIELDDAIAVAGEFHVGDASWTLP